MIDCVDYYDGKCHSLTHMCADCPDRQTMKRPLKPIPLYGIQTTLKPLTFEELRYANVQRNLEWDPDNKISGSFRGLEMQGEIGELFEVILELAIKAGRLGNTIKKLERERLGLVGSRVTFVQLAEEYADCQITLDLIGMLYSIDSGTVVRHKFNATSEKNGLQTRL